jgi:hypothetical protein
MSIELRLMPLERRTIFFAVKTKTGQTLNCLTFKKITTYNNIYNHIPILFLFSVNSLHTVCSTP